MTTAIGIVVFTRLVSFGQQHVSNSYATCCWLPESTSSHQARLTTPLFAGSLDLKRTGLPYLEFAMLIHNRRQGHRGWQSPP
ncbi:hypothetical protein M404DRAFT_998845 [Pisolithus tinctorius Marx 270]|uniref:Uncharacterized protein n=1 Tax=Pisolithus tinctorius Marx 270 TaxID=870435 RepID=A0A0C3PEN6_PISTI|nr:hypothetical protein M404DRAFT_998845 [Pisolithus tinctorius Marx 270]